MLADPAPYAVNSREHPNRVRPRDAGLATEAAAAGAGASVVLPPASWNLLRASGRV